MEKCICNITFQFCGVVIILCWDSNKYMSVLQLGIPKCFVCCSRLFKRKKDAIVAAAMTTPPTEAPRLTNLLRASKQHQHPIQSRSLQYAQISAQLESKRQEQIQEEYKTNSLSWALVKSHVGDKKVSSLEQQGATNFVSHIIKSCEVLIDATSQEQQQILPVLAKQFYKLAWQEKHKGRVLKPAQILYVVKNY